MKSINQKIREIHLRVASIEWFVGMKNRNPDLGVAIIGKDDMESTHDKHSNMSATDGILCNTTPLTT